MALVREPAVMDPESMRLEELQYELHIRGVDVDDDDCLNDTIRLVDQHRNTTVLEQRLGELNVTAEYSILESKVYEIETLIAEVNSLGITVDQPFRVVTLFVHCAHRLRRVMFRGSAPMSRKFLKLAKRLNVFQEVLMKLATTLNFPSLHVPTCVDDAAEELSGLNLSGSTEEKTSSEKPKACKKEDSSRSVKGSSKKEKKKSKRAKSPESSDDQKDSSQESSSDQEQETSKSSKSSKASRTHRTGNRKSASKVSKWTLRYSGKKDEDLHGFLEDVDDAAEVHDIGDADLLQGIGSLLEGAAKTWHRTRRSKLVDWITFKEEIKEAFCPADADDEIMEQIGRLTQKPEETYAVYEARAEELFGRLAYPMNERDKLRKLMKGLHFYYRSRIQSRHVSSVRDLRRACKDLEPDKAHLMKLERKEEKKKEERKGPKAYGITEEEEEDEGEEPVVAALAPAKRAPPTYSGVKCWRCGNTGHLSIECTKQIFCRNCGMPGVQTEVCPNCQYAREQGLWSSPAQENPGAAQMRGNLGPFNVPPPPFQPPPQLQQPLGPRAPLVTSTPFVRPTNPRLPYRPERK